MDEAWPVRYVESPREERHAVLRVPLAVVHHRRRQARHSIPLRVRVPITVVVAVHRRRLPNAARRRSCGCCRRRRRTGSPLFLLVSDPTRIA